MLKSYEGFTTNDLKVIQIAVQKLQITGIEAPMITTLLQKIEMEIDLEKIPKSDRPKPGDVITPE